MRADEASPDGGRPGLERVLPPLAIAVFALSVGLAISAAAAAGTLGCDWLAYDTYVRGFLAGAPLYVGPGDPGGVCGYFSYPPTFIFLVLPGTLLPQAVTAWIMVIVAVLAFVAGVRLLPVRRNVRWAVLLLGGLSWPVVDAIKLGQVGPLLFLLFVAGWRWMDYPLRLGTSIALGTAIKVQPALFLAWTVLTGRRRATLVALAVLAGLAIAATVVTGPGSWGDLLRVLADRSRAVSEAALVSPGRIAIDAGLSEADGWTVEVASWVLTGLAVLYVLARGSAVASYMAVLIASQFVSPVLWRHYALLLLVPVAWLLERGVRPAAVIPLLSTVVLLTVTPPVVYPLEYVLALGLVAWAGVRHAREPGVGAGWRLWRSDPSARPAEVA